jgi:hypothetical protein
MCIHGPFILLQHRSRNFAWFMQAFETLGIRLSSLMHRLMQLAFGMWMLRAPPLSVSGDNREYGIRVKMYRAFQRSDSVAALRRLNSCTSVRRIASSNSPIAAWKGLRCIAGKLGNGGYTQPIGTTYSHALFLSFF